MKNKPVIYETARCESTKHLDQLVTDMMDFGWELYGNPYTVTETYDGIASSFYCQAMVMDEKAFQKHFVDGK
jgi:hypothetical protein